MEQNREPRKKPTHIWSIDYSMTKGASLAAQLGNNLPEMPETWVRSLGWEDPLEKGKPTHFSSQPWRIPWTV